MKLVCTQRATAENKYGYTDYDTDVVSIPGLIVEMILTIPFDKPDKPYISFVVGDEHKRNDEMVSLPITRAQADALISKYAEGEQA